MSKLIYVVDDERVIAHTLAAILQFSGFEAIPFLDPLETFQLAEIRCPDILISDVMMPRLNGVDFCIQFKALYPTCRILLFSGQAVTADLLEKARDHGHDFELLAKPIHPTDLLATLNAPNEQQFRRRTLPAMRAVFESNLQRQDMRVLQHSGR